jgi:inner membrane protein
MATYLHFAPAVALASAVRLPTAGWRLMAVGALCAVMPDADLLLVALHLDHYSGTYGHRGFSHSLGFAMAIGLMGVLWARRSQRSWRRTGLVGVYLALCTSSHPLLDGVLDAGICNACLWPLDGSRLCLGWRPVPMRGVALLGWERLGTELLWIGVPLLLIANGGMLIRAVLRPSGAGRDPIFASGGLGRRWLEA